MDTEIVTGTRYPEIHRCQMNDYQHTFDTLLNMQGLLTELVDTVEVTLPLANRLNKISDDILILLNIMSQEYASEIDAPMGPSDWD